MKRIALLAALALLSTATQAALIFDGELNNTRIRIDDGQRTYTQALSLVDAWGGDWLPVLHDPTDPACAIQSHGYARGTGCGGLLDGLAGLLPMPADEWVWLGNAPLATSPNPNSSALGPMGVVWSVAGGIDPERRTSSTAWTLAYQRTVTVPEPGILALVGLGCVGTAVTLAGGPWFARRRRRALSA